MDSLASATIQEMPCGYGRGAPGPWWFKIAMKLILSNLPVSNAVWSRIGLFRHGTKNKNLTALIDSYKTHLATFRRLAGRTPETYVEIGPGSSAGHAVCAAASGAKTGWLVDVGDFAETDPDHYRAVASWLRDEGQSPPDLDGAATRAEILSLCRATYLTNGIDGLRGLPANSIDLVFSEAVMEHLPLGQFDAFLAETLRVLKPGGIASHGVDLADHLGGSLNHLRLPERFWEFPAVARAGFYTNRLRLSGILARAKAAGFDVTVDWIARWPTLPLPRHVLSREFRDLSEDDLRVGLFGLVLRKPAS